MYEKYKQDCEDVMQENENKTEKLMQEIQQLKDVNHKSEEKLTLTEKQLDDTLGKMKTIAEKNVSTGIKNLVGK
jgi:seryl-tRNA synthetase